MKPLTPAAQANLDSGATTGAGTFICIACTGPKEPSRLNSARCAACGKGGLKDSTSPSPYRVISATLPTEVASRLAAEAAEHDQQANDFLTALIIERDKRRQTRLSNPGAST